MNRGVWIGSAALWILAALLSTGIHPNRYEAGRSRDPVAGVKRNQSSLARILGEFRTGLSDILFIKTERYLHSGVAYVPHLTEELLTVEGTGEEVEHHEEEMTHSHGDHSHAHGEHSHAYEDHSHAHGEDHEDDHFHHDGEVEMLVPTAKQDYRGWIGHMQRQVQPWQDPSEAHIHTDGRELLPWFRLMTLSDPGYVRGYVLGAFWVERVDPEAALEFIEEGLEANPTAFQLHLSKGYILMRMARNLDPGVAFTDPSADRLELLRQAKASFHEAADYIDRVRPPMPDEGEITDLPNWNTYQETDARGAITLSLLFEERYGNPEQLPVLREQYRQIMPDHPRLR